MYQLTNNRPIMSESIAKHPREGHCPIQKHMPSITDINIKGKVQTYTSMHTSHSIYEQKFGPMHNVFGIYILQIWNTGQNEACSIRRPLSNPISPRRTQCARSRVCSMVPYCALWTAMHIVNMTICFYWTKTQTCKIC